MPDYSLPQEISDAVATDGLPRVATDTLGSGTQHVFFLNARGTVESMLASAWLATRGPLPTDPTPQESAAAIAARAAATQQAAADAAQLRQQIIALAQSAVGVRLDALTGPQVRALFALTVLRPAGAVAPDLTVRPLGEWLT